MPQNRPQVLGLTLNRSENEAFAALNVVGTAQTLCDRRATCSLGSRVKGGLLLARNSDPAIDSSHAGCCSSPMAPLEDAGGSAGGNAGQPATKPSVHNSVPALAAKPLTSVGLPIAN
jgi:hypothetical protein